MASKRNSQAAVERRKRFVAEYLVDMNGAAAAKRAGYGPKGLKQRAHILLARPDVQAALRQAVARQQKRLDLSADRVLLELMRVAYVDPVDIAGEGGAIRRSLHDIPEDTRRAIASVKVKTERFGEGDDGREVDTVEYRFWSKNEAAIALGKHLKLFTDVVEARVENLSREERAARAAALLEIARQRRDASKP